MAPWSDSKKWWLDLLKSVLGFAIASLVGYFAIDRVREARACNPLFCFLADSEPGDAAPMLGSMKFLVRQCRKTEYRS